MNLNTYQKTAITTVAAVIFLIFVGGLVRATGAGLGCPDWPTCFGMWIPPVSAAELPPGYDPAQFNVLKTWTEYLNRLVGVVIGLLITATGVLSFRYRKTKPAVFYSSIAAFVMVLIQGWLGGRVVETGLNVGLITIHMMLAMAIMVVLLYAVFKSTAGRWRVKIDDSVRWWLYVMGIVLFVFTLAQLVIGTEVREAVDTVKYNFAREDWLAQISHIDEFHRSFAWTVLLSGLGVVAVVIRKTKSKLLKKISAGIFAVIILQIALGVGLSYFGMPPAFQIFHLTGAAILICLEFFFLLLVNANKNLP